MKAPNRWMGTPDNIKQKVMRDQPQTDQDGRVKELKNLIEIMQDKEDQLKYNLDSCWKIINTPDNKVRKDLIKAKELIDHFKVHLTSEGDYPDAGIMVLWDDGNECYIGGYDSDGGGWFAQGDEVLPIEDNQPGNVVAWCDLQNLFEIRKQQEELK